MSEKEKKIAGTLKRVLPNLPEAKKEYLLGFAEGMALATDRKAGTSAETPLETKDSA